jgi:hypothetical protein
VVLYAVSVMRRTVLCVCATLAALSTVPGRAVVTGIAAQRIPVPSLVLWAWERPEDLRGLGTSAGVAFLSQTITLDRSIVVQPRRQPLHVDPSTSLIAVTRIETAPGAIASDADTTDLIAAAIARTATLPQVVGVQVDFDAVRSERTFYRDLLTRVRALLPSTVPMSVTSLASWCAGDRWLDRLPIDEAVAMMFRLGPMNEPYAEIAETPAAAARECNALGTSLDEPIRVRRAGRRIYVFNPKAWTRDTVVQARGVAG